MDFDHLTKTPPGDPIDDKIDPDVFGLAPSHLLSALENALPGGKARDVAIAADTYAPSRYYGARGHKVIVTYSYTRPGGRRAQTRLFVKRHSHPGTMEEWQYRRLHEHGAPIPRLHLAVRDPQDREILFLELVDTDPRPDEEFIRDEGALREFITLVARFNAIRPHPDYAASLQNKDVGGALGTAVCSWLEQIWRQACQGQLGPALMRWCLTSGDQLCRLQKLAVGLAVPLRNMDRGLCSNDCYPHATGRRPVTGERLLFDLEFVSLAPRFRDIARWLGMPETVGSYCVPRARLSQWYLSGRASTVPLSQFQDETTLLWASSTLGDLKRCWRAAQKRPHTEGQTLLEKLRILVAAEPQVNALLS
jgi:hypothetical protein